MVNIYTLAFCNNQLMYGITKIILIKIKIQVKYYNVKC